MSHKMAFAKSSNAMTCLSVLIVAERRVYLNKSALLPDKYVFNKIRHQTDFMEVTDTSYELSVLILWRALEGGQA